MSSSTEGCWHIGLVFKKGWAINEKEMNTWTSDRSFGWGERGNKNVCVCILERRL